MAVCDISGGGPVRTVAPHIKPSESVSELSLMPETVIAAEPPLSPETIIAAEPSLSPEGAGEPLPPLLSL